MRALAAGGRADEATEALARLEATASLLGTAPVRASVAFHTGVVTSAAGDHGGARASFEDARDLFVRCHAPYDAALAQIELSRALAVLGEPEAADREAKAALRQLDELGATVAAERATAVLRQLAPPPGSAPPARLERRF